MNLHELADELGRASAGKVRKDDMIGLCDRAEDSLRDCMRVLDSLNEWDRERDLPDDPDDYEQSRLREIIDDAHAVLEQLDRD